MMQSNTYDLETLDKLYLEFSNVTSARNRREIVAHRLVSEAYVSLVEYASKYDCLSYIKEPLNKIHIVMNVLARDE
jgi:hypothetical protein